MDSAKKEKILEVKNTSVVIEGEELVGGVSFVLNRGEAVAIIGPNGAGKTVLFRALLGLLPYKGEIVWKEGIKIGYVPQRFLVERSFPISVYEFFLLKSSFFWLPQKEFVGHLHHELNLVGLKKDILSRALGELSSGQLQRVLVSWAMVDHPDVLFFDEPTGGIDVGAEETIYGLIRRVQDERGTSVLLISHDLNIVYKHAETVVCLNKKMVCHGRPQEVLSPDELSRLYGVSGFYRHN